MSAKFEIKKSSNGQFFFNLRAGNGQIVLTSEQYKSKVSAENGIKAVRTNAGTAARFERLKAKNGKPYFVLKAANGEVVGRSQQYASAASVRKGMASVKANAPAAAVADLT